MTKELIIPTVHMNGSGKKNLIEGYVQAASVISEAISAVCNSYPHERDYYVQENSNENFRIAQHQHRDRLARLDSIRLELHALAEGVYKQ